MFLIIGGVIVLGSVMTGAWILRFFYAYRMWSTKLVQLSPRTTALILCCLLVFSTYAVSLWHERLPEDSAARTRSRSSGWKGGWTPRRSPRCSDRGRSCRGSCAPIRGR